MIYLLLVNAALAVGFGLYQICFRKLTFFQWNRFYLLGMVAISMLVPIGLYIDVSSIFVTDEIIPYMDLSDVTDIMYQPMNLEQSTYSLMELVMLMYWTGSVICMAILIRRLLSVREAFLGKGAYVSFSFFNKVFLGSKVRNLTVIDKHEQVHVDQGHSYDIMFLELVCLLNWFNPIIYLVRKELKFQHECIADEACSDDRIAYAELLVANAMRTDSSNLVHEFSNQSFLKKRIMMLFKNKSSNSKRLLYLVGLPVLVTVVLSTLVFNTSRAKEVIASVESQIADVELPKTISDVKIAQSDAVFSTENKFNTKDIHSLKDNKIIQHAEPGNATEQEEKIVENPEVFAEPKGGMTAFRKWIGENYQYPKSAIDADVKGIIQVEFIVEKDGSLSNIKIKEDIGHSTGEAAVKLLEKSEKWLPGIDRGKRVRTAFLLPIRLDLTNMGTKTYRAKPELGMEKLQEWLVSNYKSPRRLTSDDLDPYMSAYFDVNPDGSLSNFAVRSELDESFKSKFIDLLKNTKWIPAEDNGVKQKSRAWVGLRLAGNGAVISNNERVEVLPEPKGGMMQFIGYVEKKTTSPKVLERVKQEGLLVEIGFDVLPSGELGNFKIVKEMYSGIGKDVILATKSFGNWAPGIIDGKKTVTSYILPVHYAIINGKSMVKIAGLKGGNMKVFREN